MRDFLLVSDFRPATMPVLCSRALQQLMCWGEETISHDTSLRPKESPSVNESRLELFP
jgi:hypothetical protein